MLLLLDGLKVLAAAWHTHRAAHDDVSTSVRRPCADAAAELRSTRVLAACDSDLLSSLTNACRGKKMDCCCCGNRLVRCWSLLAPSSRTLLRASRGPTPNHRGGHFVESRIVPPRRVSSLMRRQQRRCASDAIWMRTAAAWHELATKARLVAVMEVKARGTGRLLVAACTNGTHTAQGCR